MTPIATVICYLFIYGLFRLVRDPNIRTSKAIWIPVLWLFIGGSRPVSTWFNDAPSATGATQYYSGNPVEASVFQALIAAALIALIKRKPQAVAVLKNNWPLVAYFTYCLLSALWSNYTYISAKRWTKAVGDPLMVLIILTEHEPLAAAKRVITRTGFFLFPISILLIEAYGSGITGGTAMTAPMVVGITTGKNELGMICMVWGLGFLWCFLDEWRRKGRRSSLVAYAAAVGMAVWLLNRCGSATSLSCLLAAGLVILITNLRFVARKPILVHGLVVAVICAVLGAIFVAPSLLSSVGRNATLTGRTDIWRLVLGMKGNPLIGTGYESFWLGWRLERMWALYWWHPIESHEGYIETYLSLGWIGIALLAAVVLRGYLKTVASMRKGMAMGNLKIAYITAALLYNLTESAFHPVHPVWIMLLFATTIAPPMSTTDRPLIHSEQTGKEAGSPEAHLWFGGEAVCQS